MRTYLFTAFAFVAFSGAVHPAIAADLPTRPSYSQPTIMTPVPVYNWTGIYVGFNGGYAFGTQDPLSLFSSDYSAFSYSANGWLAGGTVGAQIQSGHVVMGLEGDIDWTNISGSGTGPVTKLGVLFGTATLSSSVSSISTLRARVGYAQDNWLFYGTAGLAVTKSTSSFTQTVGFLCSTSPPAGPGVCSSKSDLHPGLAAGAGIEYGITPNLSAKLEYMWVGAGAGNTLYENMARIGLNYRFGGT
jgi:outer membrane immunogenic protein